VAALVAFLVGLLTIRALVGVAARVNLEPFVIAVGVLMIAGAVWQSAAS
jgi:undecaprenyl pyrophosphate phosphatase UppP